MGYAKIKEPLMYEFTGKPYIDTRLSFASLIPKKINRKLNLKLVEHWSKILISKPYLHDKIEFEIVDGSYDFNTTKNIYRNYNFLSKKEKNRYLNSLKEITENQIKYFQEKFHNLNKKLIKLENSRSSLIKKFRTNKKNFLLDLKKFMNLIKSNGICSPSESFALSKDDILPVSSSKLIFHTPGLSIWPLPQYAYAKAYAADPPSGFVNPIRYAGQGPQVSPRLNPPPCMVSL